MKRILVVLLALSVMGGVFAQESGWGELSGEAGLKTSLDFAQPQGVPVDLTTMNGGYFDGANDFWFEATWKKAFGPWDVTLPLRLERTYFGTGYNEGRDNKDDDDDLGDGLAWDAWNYDDTTANIAYTSNNGKLKVTVPFYFEFSNQNNVLYFDGTKWSVNMDLVTRILGNNKDDVAAFVLAFDPTVIADAGISSATLFAATGNPNPFAKDGAYDIAAAVAAKPATSDIVSIKYANGNPNGGDMVGIIPTSRGNIAVGAEYQDEYWGFKIGFENLLTDPSISKAGGYYKFMGGKSQLWVSRGAYETKWWRASEYVLEPNFKSSFSPYGTGAVSAADPHWDANIMPFHWENIEDNGIAYRFYLMDTLQIGLAFASAENFSDTIAPPFYSDPSDKRVDDLLIYDFLKHPVFGVRYDNGQLDVSAMIGLEPNGFESVDWTYNPSTLYGWMLAADGSWTMRTGAYTRAKKLDKDSMVILLHLGAAYKLSEQFKINGDISGAFGLVDGVDPSKNHNIFNAGVEASYTNDPLWAGLGVKVLDALNPYGLMWGIDYAVGFNNSRDGYGWKKDSQGQGPWAGLYGHIYGFLPETGDNATDIGVMFDAGYKNLALTDKLNFSITAGMGLELLFYKPVTDSDKKVAFSFSVKPELDWAVFSNGSIHFIYELGSSDVVGERTKFDDTLPLTPGMNAVLDTNKFTTKFKWWL